MITSHEGQYGKTAQLRHPLILPQKVVARSLLSFFFLNINTNFFELSPNPTRGNSHHNRFYSSYLVIGYPIFLSNSKVRSYSWITCDGHGRRKMYHQCSLRIKSLIIAGRFVEFVKRLRLFLRKHYLNPIKVQRWGLGNPRK